MKYDGFISYSHTADGRLAPAVQAGLQRLARPWYRRRALRMFRDETGLAVNPHLWGSIATAMNDSRYFVLLASPDAAASGWVNREIAHWLETHPPETILPVLTDGTLEWSDTLGDFDPATSTALPTALWGVFAEEPRYVDLRWAHGEEQLDLRHSRFRAQVATVAAPMHGIAREDLEGEDVRLHRRAMRLAWAAAAAMLVLTAGALLATGVAVSYAATARSNEARAVRNAREASTQRSLALTNARQAKSQKAAAESNAARAARSAQEAQTQQALAETNATRAQRNANEAAANGAQAQANATRAAANAAEAQRNATAAQQAADEARHNAAEATWNAAVADGQRQRAEHNTLTAISRQLAAKSLVELGRSFDLALLEAVAAGQVQDTSEARGSLLQALLDQPSVRKIIHPTNGADWIAISTDGNTIATVNTSELEVWDRASGRLLTHRPAPPSFAHSPVFGPDGTLAVVFGDRVTIFEARTLNVRATFTPNLGQEPSHLAVGLDGLVAVGSGNLSGPRDASSFGASRRRRHSSRPSPPWELHRPSR